MNSDNQVICPLCNDKVDRLLYRYHIDAEKRVVEEIKKQNPDWSVNDGICSRCVDYYHTEIVMQQRILPEIGPYFPVKSPDDFVILPTGLRLDADQRFTGKGVTICFIDSGFYPHPDLISHKKRIRQIIDITKEGKSPVSLSDESELQSGWHGTMTSVVCAGDGFLSNGLYKGIASDADLVLLKVQDGTGRITTVNIVKALEWVLVNYKKYGIRIINMSLGDDEQVSYKLSEVDRLVQQLFDLGIVVVAAVGNDENGSIKPPANSPAVIAVGGIDDNNSLNEPVHQLYHSSYGKTNDDLMKPELLAHAIWIAAPILPGTLEQKEAAALFQLFHLPDSELINKVRNDNEVLNLDGEVKSLVDAEQIRSAIKRRMQTCKYISPHYMHVDGTSFAAPIVSAVAAQLIEARPNISSAAIREILLSTAKRIASIPVERQGFGMVRPRNSILRILKRETIMAPGVTPLINENQKTIEFYLRHECASQVSLAGSFNHWAQDVLLMEPGNDGAWKIAIPMLPAGKYHYKFYVDDKTWIEDVNNPFREPDGFNGFNSILVVNN